MHSLRGKLNVGSKDSDALERPRVRAEVTPKQRLGRSLGPWSLQRAPHILCQSGTIHNDRIYSVLDTLMVQGWAEAEGDRVLSFYCCLFYVSNRKQVA